MRLYTQDHPAFTNSITVTWRTSDGVDRILDFQQRIDRIEFLNGVEDFGDIDISQRGDDVLIEVGGAQIIVLNEDDGAFSAADFIF